MFAMPFFIKFLLKNRPNIRTKNGVGHFLYKSKSPIFSPVFASKYSIPNRNIVQTVNLDNKATVTVTVQKIGKIVYVTADVSLPDTYNTDGPFWLCTLPYNPESAHCFFTGFRGNSNILGNPCRGHITPSGVVQVWCPVGSSGGLRFSVTFFTNNS